MNKDAAKLLHNTYVLYIIAAVAFLNLMILLIGGDVFHAIVFLIIGYLTSFFSKNMVVILAIALAATNLIKFGLSYAKEGMENQEEKDNQEEEEEIKEGLDQEEDAEEEDVQEGLDQEGEEEDAEAEVTEGMATLGYSSIVPSLLEDQSTLFTNISKLTPYVIKAENASIQETKMKYENFRSK